MFNTNDFSYKNRVFSAEVSDFGPNRFEAVFDTTFDDEHEQGYFKGFELVSARTGKIVKMIHNETFRDREGDITHWEFIPYRNTSFDKLVVFND